MLKIILRGGVMALAIVAAGPAFAADIVHVGKASPTSDVMLPVDIGVKAGIFQKHGLDVQIATFTGGGKLHQAEAAGAIDIGVGAGAELALLARGAEEMAICNAVGPAPFLGVGVGADSTAKTLDDLKGKRIGVSSNGSLTFWLSKELARVKGWGPDGVTTVTTGNAAQNYIAALKTHEIDAFISTTSLSLQLAEKGEGRLLAPVTSYTGNMAAGVIYATKQEIAAHPDDVRRFLAGWFDTIAWMRQHKDETVKIEAALTGFSPKVEGEEYDLTIGMFSKDGKFDQQSLETLKRSFADLKLLDSPPDFSKLTTEAFLPKS